MARKAVGAVAILLAILAAYLLPTAIPQPYILNVLIVAATYAIPAVGLNLMMGYTGLISIGHMAFAGIGGYLAAVAMVDLGLSFWLSLVMGTAAAAAVGAAVGATCLHLRNHYFIIVTLATGMILFSVFNNWDTVTHGAEGFAGIPRPASFSFFGIEADFRRLSSFYYLIVTLLLFMLAVQAIIVRSDFGRILKAINQDEVLAAFRGVDVALYKIAIFTIGSGMAGFGGVVKVTFLRVASPLTFEMQESVNLALIVIAGGAGYQIGPVLGALVFSGVPEYLRVAREYRLVIFGALLVLMTLFMPEGIAGLGDRCLKAFKRRGRDAA